MAKLKLRIKLKSFDHTMLDVAAEKIVDTKPNTFTVEIPKDVPPTYTGKLTSVIWQVAVDLDIAKGSDVECTAEFHIYSECKRGW